MSWLRRMHDLPGVLLRDVPRYRRALARSGRGQRSDAEGWISLCNRIEQLRVATDGPGVECNWVWGSALHATGVLPVLGRQLLRAALCEWPIAFATQPRVTSDTPLLSFVFAHGGVDRLPQLQRTIRSIFAQQDVPCECIVVDQSPTPLLGQLPAPVVYRHLAKDGVPSGWHKAWAYNIGARLARGRILVFHDGDVCAPEGYAREIVATIEQRGYAAASLQRLLFYLSPEDTHCLERNDEIQSGFTPIMAYQNWKGGTIAIARDAFIGLGGIRRRLRRLGRRGRRVLRSLRRARTPSCRLPAVRAPLAPAAAGPQAVGQSEHRRRDALAHGHRRRCAGGGTRRPPVGRPARAGPAHQLQEPKASRLTCCSA